MAYSNSKYMIRKILAWAQKNERHLGGIVFIFGFVTDLLAMYLLDAPLIFAAFSIYLAMVATLVLVGHALAHWRESPRVWKRSVLVIVPLVAQYQLGNLLSWFLIFYAKSAVIEASWPFIILIALVFIGNEWFRTYRDRIAFVAVLLFFAVYLYAIFALPLFVHRIGPEVFLTSTVLALGVFSIYLGLLWVVGSARIAKRVGRILLAACVTVGLVTGAYFTGLVPPIPLSLKDGGIYHSLVRADGQYVLSGEGQRAWWDPRPDVVHVIPGRPIYAFAAVFAPTRFGTTVVHRWQRYDTDARVWVTTNRIAFPITGGRDEGYRGYSETTAVTPGKWRVRVETEYGQVIGQIRFTAIPTTVLPPLETDHR